MLLNHYSYHKYFPFVHSLNSLYYIQFRSFDRDIRMFRDPTKILTITNDDILTYSDYESIFKWFSVQLFLIFLSYCLFLFKF